jgi:hypothetical protein
MRGAIPPHPNTPSWPGDLLKHNDNFTFNDAKKKLINYIMCNISFYLHNREMFGWHHVVTFKRIRGELLKERDVPHETVR